MAPRRRRASANHPLITHELACAIGEGLWLIEVLIIRDRRLEGCGPK